MILPKGGFGYGLKLGWGLKGWKWRLIQNFGGIFRIIIQKFGMIFWIRGKIYAIYS